MSSRSSVAYIGIGANLFDARATVAAAIVCLGQMPRSVLLAASSLYRTAPIDAGGDDYINAVACVETQLAAPELLQRMQAIELAHGRERPSRNAPRTLDLDLLLYGAAHIASATLQVPHPRMSERAFVLIPLLELAPAITIPGLGPARQFLGATAHQVIGKIG